MGRLRFQLRRRFFATQGRDRALSLVNQFHLSFKKPVVICPESDPRISELLGPEAATRFQYLERLGSGGMGVIHKVRDRRDDRVVALKILRDGLSGSSKALDRFFREARICSGISHPNIIKVYDYSISSSSAVSYIVMEFIDGRSLREVIDRRFNDSNPISFADYTFEIVGYIIQLCWALEAVHVRGIVHRDVKPDNVMINLVGEVKITDFGILHLEEATFTPTGAMLGTPRYMSPEQVRGDKVDGRSDIYAVGIVLYECLTGRPPFLTGDVSYQQVHNQPLPPQEVNSEIPRELNDIILRCLEKAPENRYPDGGSLKAALRTLSDRLATSATGIAIS